MRGTPFFQLPDRYPVKGSRYYNMKIARRTWYIMQADLTIPPSTSGRSFGPSDFLNNQEFPFEVVTFRPNITTLDSQGVPQVDPTIGSLYRYVQITMKIQGLARDICKANSRLSAIIDGSTLDMNFPAPLYLELAMGLDVTGSNAITSASAAGGIRLECGFMGSLLEFEQ